MSGLGPDARLSLFVAYFIRLPSPAALDAARAVAAGDGWQVAAYADYEGWVLRLAYEQRLAVTDLERDRCYLTTFATTHGGSWIAATIEDLHAPGFWEQLASRGAMPRPRPSHQAGLSRDANADAERHEPSRVSA